MSAVLSATEFEALLGTGLSTDDDDIIDQVITREEDALALLVGDLTGEITQTFYPGGSTTTLPDYPWRQQVQGYDGPLGLRRFTSSVTVTDDGTDVSSVVRLLADGRGRAGGAIERQDGPWSGIVVAVYTPSDSARLKRYLIEATRAALLPDRDRVPAEDRASAMSHLQTAVAERRRLMRDITPAPRSWSIRSRPSDRFTHAVESGT